jgi:hypothetical protein
MIYTNHENHVARVSTNMYNHLKDLQAPELVLDLYVSKKGSLPRVIRKIYIDGNGLKAWKLTDDPIKETLNNLPNWGVEIYDDQRVVEVLEKDLGEDHEILKAYRLIHPDSGVVRSDLAKLVIMYLYGGLYLDNKSYIKKAGLPKLAKDKDILLSPWVNGMHTEFIDDGGEVINWYIYARAGSNTLKTAIEKAVFNINRIYNDSNL